MIILKYVYDALWISLDKSILLRYQKKSQDIKNSCPLVYYYVCEATKSVLSYAQGICGLRNAPISKEGPEFSVFTACKEKNKNEGKIFAGGLIFFK